MTVAEQVKEKIDSFETGFVFSIDDFGLKGNQVLALAKMLSRMVAGGELKRAARGKYYKPRETMFGVIGPAYNELVKDFLTKDGRMVGYVTGTAAFSSMGITTQITSELLIGTNIYRRPMMRNGYRVRFLRQKNEITKENVDLLRLLDAVLLIREIPAVTPDEACETITGLVRMLSTEQRAELERLALAYTSYVRAVVGAILEMVGTEAPLLKLSLKWTSRYDLPLSERVLPNKKNWRIV